MKPWIYLILALTIIFTIMVWNANNSTTYKRLRKAKARWDATSPEFRANAKAQAKQDLQDLRGDIGDLWGQITDVFDNEDKYSRCY